MENVNSGAGGGNILERLKGTNNMSIQTRYTEQVYTIHNICKTNDELVGATPLQPASDIDILENLIKKALAADKIFLDINGQ